MASIKIEESLMIADYTTEFPLWLHGLTPPETGLGLGFMLGFEPKTMDV